MISEGIIASNKRARHLYFLEKSIEAGIVLNGDEVKSLRTGTCDLRSSFVEVREGEVFLIDTFIPPYRNAASASNPRRSRKLLLNHRQIKKLNAKLNQGGFTCVPLELYFNSKGVAKIKIALAKGKKKYDHKDAILERTRDNETRIAKRSIGA